VEVKSPFLVRFYVCSFRMGIRLEC
jgi:hypothetical protein